MLLACLLTLLLTSVAAAPLGRWLGRSAGYVLAVPLLGVAVLLTTAVVDAGVVTQSVAWMPTLDVHLAMRADGLSLLFALLVTVVGAAVLVYSARYLGTGRQSSFYVLMTAFAAAMLALVLADDVVVLFVAWEATTFCSFFLIARSGTHAQEPALRTLLVTVFGGLLLLAGVITMAVATGTTQLSAIITATVWADNPTLTTVVAVLIAVAAFTKSAQFPFQAWLPDSMVAITPVSTYLHAAAMVKAGIYLLLRFSPLFHGVTIWHVLLITCGVITAVIGATAALRRFDLKELLAYSTISQLGFLVAVIGVGTTYALTAAVIHTLAHALFKAALFMFVGVLDHEAGTRDIRELARLRLTMPVTKAAITLAALSMAGVPPLLGFVSKETLFTAFPETPGPAWTGVLVTAVMALAAIFTFVYCGRIVFGTFTGDGSRGTIREASPLLWGAPTLLAAAGLALGVAPFVLDPLASSAVTAASRSDVHTHLALWHGVNTALVISLVIIGVGTALVANRVRLEPVVARLRFPFSALDIIDATRAGIITAGTRIGKFSGTTSPRLHLGIPAVVITGMAAYGLTQVGSLPPVIGSTSRPFDWVLVVLILAGTIATVRARTRIAAIVVTGVVGFSMTLWFFTLGAADVALTQLLVEILTLCVMVLLLRRLPRRFSTDAPRRRIPAIIIAVGAGLATVVAVWALTGRRELSAAAEYYLTQGEETTGGANIVNTILVDFRALDTLGELSVLGVAGVAIATLLYSRKPIPIHSADLDEHSPLADSRRNTVFVRSLSRVLGPLVVLMSLLLLLRGHQEPGGGFIAALIGGAGFTLLYLAAPSDTAARVRLPFLKLIGAGIVTGVGTGLIGYAKGSFLTPIHMEILGWHTTTALVFDLGVYLSVIGVILAALNLLGRQHRVSQQLAWHDPDDPGFVHDDTSTHDTEEVTTR